MNYDWKPLAPEDVTGFAEEAGYLTRRIAEMSPKERRIFRAALGMNPQKDLASMAAITHRLHTFDYYVPVTDEVATALRDLGAGSLYECELLEAKCALPGIDLTAGSSSLRKLVFDASSLGHTLREEGSHDRHFMDKLKAALAYENCDRLDFARDIVANLACYDFIPEDTLKATAERIMPEGHFGQPVLLNAFDYEAFAGDYHRSKGMEQVDGGFFMRNDRAFQFEHATSPSEQMAERLRQNLAARLDEAFDRCWQAYEAGLREQAPGSLIHMSEQIALTRTAFNGFRGGRGLSIKMMKTLLTFENPLDMARDAWQVCTGSDTPEVVGHYLQTLLDDPNIEEYYGPRLEPQGHPAEPELTME